MKISKFLLICGLAFIINPMLLSGEEDHSHLNYIGFGGFNFKISEVNIVKNVKTADGMINAENRNNHLVEVKLIGICPSTGLSLMNQTAFSAVFKYRKIYRVVAAKGVGLKPEVAPGKIVDILLSDPEGNINIETSEGDSEQIIFLYFELPKEIKEFQIQVPSLIQGSHTF